MRTKLLELLACPECQGPLGCHATRTADDGEVLEGELGCPGCGVVYPVPRGIPRFVPSENYASSFG